MKYRGSQGLYLRRATQKNTGSIHAWGEIRTSALYNDVSIKKHCSLKTIFEEKGF
jgi:hypothetical protein